MLTRQVERQTQVDGPALGTLAAKTVTIIP
jgi:hypothetical protein